MAAKVSQLSSSLIARKGSAIPSSASLLPEENARQEEPACTLPKPRMATGEQQSGPTEQQSGPTEQQSGPTEQQSGPTDEKRSGAPIPKGTANTIAVTVRLDEERYRKLKHYGVDHRKTNQQIFVEALDALLP
jgi:hypothetical protein